MEKRSVRTFDKYISGEFRTLEVFGGIHCFDKSTTTLNEVKRIIKP